MIVAVLCGFGGGMLGWNGWGGGGVWGYRLSFAWEEGRWVRRIGRYEMCSELLRMVTHQYRRVV